MTNHQDTSTERTGIMPAPTVRPDQIGHWYDSPDAFVIVQAKDVKLGAQTYALASRDEAAQQPQGQAVSDEEIQVAAFKLMEQHPEWVTLINAVPLGSELSPFAVGLVRAILALRDKPATSPDGTPNNAI